MKRFHVHTHVDDLQASIDFYSRMFAAAPTRIEDDYTLGSIPVFSERAAAAPEPSACCAASAPRDGASAIAVRFKSSCC
ncbi:MAG: hypothetical protein ACSLE9_20990 [Burkholderiaceae bacterium]